jgi:hypothetical protein
MLAHIERHPWNWDRALEAVKVFGVLIAAFWALVQYGNQIEQDRTDAILRAVQVVHDNRAVEFRKDLDDLVSDSESDRLYYARPNLLMRSWTDAK